MRRFFALALLSAVLNSTSQAQALGVPLKMEPSSAKAYLSHCSPTDATGVKHELEAATQQAKNVEDVLAVTLLFITGDEAGKAEQEFIPVLLSKAKTGVKLVRYWDQFQSWWSGRSNATEFEICEPIWRTFVVVKPVNTASNPSPAAGLAGLPPQAWRRLPSLPPIPADLKLGSVQIPVCSSLPTDYLAGLSQMPWIGGRVVLRNTYTGTVSPLSSQTVSLLSNTWMRCATAEDGTFLFPKLLPGKYTLYIGTTVRVIDVLPTTTFNMGDVQ
jgi:hypothetical protein